MTPETVIDIGQQAMQVIISILALLLLPALGVGILISLLQAATQIHEVTMTFIPKLLTTFLVLIVGGPWMIHMLVNYTEKLISSIPTVIG